MSIPLSKSPFVHAIWSSFFNKPLFIQRLTIHFISTIPYVITFSSVKHATLCLHCNSRSVTVTKRHQLCTLFFYPHYMYIQKISKVVYEKMHAFNSVCCLKRLHFLPIYNKCTYAVRTWLLGVFRISWHSFLENNFASGVPWWNLSGGKNKSRFCPVIGGVSLQQHLLLNCQTCSWM